MDTFWAGAISSLLGALVGGISTAIAAIHQSKATLEAATEQANATLAGSAEQARATVEAVFADARESARIQTQALTAQWRRDELTLLRQRTYDMIKAADEARASHDSSIPHEEIAARMVRREFDAVSHAISLANFTALGLQEKGLSDELNQIWELVPNPGRVEELLRTPGSGDDCCDVSQRFDQISELSHMFGYRLNDLLRLPVT